MLQALQGLKPGFRLDNLLLQHLRPSALFDVAPHSRLQQQTLGLRKHFSRFCFKDRLRYPPSPCANAITLQHLAGAGYLAPYISLVRRDFELLKGFFRMNTMAFFQVAQPAQPAAGCAEFQPIFPGTSEKRNPPAAVSHSPSQLFAYRPREPACACSSSPRQ